MLIKMAKRFLVIMSMAESNLPHMDKLRFMILMVDDQIRMYVPELNHEYYFPTVTELEDDEHEEGYGDDDPPEYISDDKDMSDTEYGVTSRYNNQLVG